MPKLRGFKEVLKLTEDSEQKNIFAELYQSYYQSVSQEVRKGNEGRGAVCVRFMGEDEEKWEYFEQQVNAAVADALDKGYRLSDIAVLTSSNDDGSFLGQTLSAAGYKVISSESLLLCTSPEVNLVLAVLRYVCRPDDKLAQYVIAHYVLNRDSKEVSAQLEKLIPKLGDEKKFSQFMSEQHVQLNRQQLAEKPLYTLATEILRIFSISEANAFVIALMDNILDYLKTQNGEVASFLDWWERKGSGLALKAPSGLDAITISTIHKAKGLQYSVVILPFTQYGQSLTKKDYWYAKEDEEVPYLLLKMGKSLDELGLGDVYEREDMLSVMDSLNKIYVAQTRAENRMYILTGRQDSARGNYNLMLYDFVQKSMAEENKEMKFVQEEDDELCFWWGNRDERRKNKDKKEECQCDDITQMYCAGFDPEKLSTHVVKAETREQEVGNAIHDYLSRQEHFPLTLEEVERWSLPDAQPYAEEIRDALRCIARHTEWHPYFADGVKVLNEVSILPTRQFIRNSATGDKVQPRITYRPDRVVQLADGVVVLDYKTGHPTDEARAAYERQVATYVELLSAMALGPVRGEVLYLNEE
jgi:ATP-dependent exoDNAse (exonuclease V) beta subunit